jgi:hypothetical protein
VADVTEVADIAPDLELTDQRVIVPFEFDGGWYAMGGSWTMAGITYVPLRADSMFGPFEVVERAPAIPLRGRSTVGLQYGHALHGTEVLGDGWC